MNALKRIGVIGDVMLDVTLEEPELRESFEAESAFIVRGSGWRYNLGGAGNVAEVLATTEWGDEVVPCLVGEVGRDDNGRIVRELAHRLGDDSCLFEVDRPTTTKLRASVPGSLTPRVDVEMREPTTVQDHIFNVVADCDAIVLADYGKGFFSAWPEDWKDRLPDVPIIVDAKPEAIHRFAGATVWCPNQRELAGVLPDYDSDWTDLAVLVRAEHDIGWVCVTAGPVGCYVCNGESEFLPASVPGKVVSTIGAGDAFCAGLAVSMATNPNAPDREHALYAMATAEKYVTTERHQYQ